MPVHRPFALLATLLAALMLGSLGGCASYSVPGKPADFRAMGITADQQAQLTDASIAERMSRKPAASFPATIAVIRVQDGGYSSYTIKPSESTGRFSVITVRDVETDEQFQQLAKLPMVAAIAPINRLVAPSAVNREIDLRSAAANLHADIVMLYTFDTTFYTDNVVPALGVITLGLAPDRVANVTSTASAVLLDTRTGYVYGIAEGTANTSQIASGWTNSDAIDQCRRRVEGEAFGKLVNQVGTTWRGVAAQYGPHAPTGAPGEAAAAAPAK